MATVLVVYFTQRDNSVIIDLLTQAGYLVRQALDWPTLVAALDEQVDLVLFDALNEDELLLLPQLRAACRCPLLVIGPTRNQRLVVRALDQGADDYLLRPFHGGELLARMRAQLRRFFFEHRWLCSCLCDPRRKAPRKADKLARAFALGQVAAAG